MYTNWTEASFKSLTTKTQATIRASLVILLKRRHFFVIPGNNK